MLADICIFDKLIDVDPINAEISVLKDAEAEGVRGTDGGVTADADAV